MAARKRKEFGDYIVSDPEICGGDLTFKGTRVLVKDVLYYAGQGKDWKESDRRFAERSKLSEENLKTYLDQSEKNRTTPSDNLKQEARPRRK